MSEAGTRKVRNNDVSSRLGTVHQIVERTAEILALFTSAQLGSLLPKFTVNLEPSLEISEASSERNA